MISEVSHSEEWIQEKRETFNKADPLLVEKAIKAFTLLDALSEEGLEFIFKGGTSLLLLLPKPLRFSIDIDIIIEGKPEDFEKQFDKIIDRTVFTRYAVDERKSSDIPKEHYKFYYESALAGQGEQYILLDILYAENPYPELITKPVEFPLIKVEGSPEQVKLPDVNGILGDKLTAFAPGTIGIPVGEEKELEIIKQLFDIAQLFNYADDLLLARKAFDNVAELEIGFRKKDIHPTDVLADTFHTSLVLSLRGKKDKPLYKELESGIRRIESYIFKRFKIDEAILSSAKAAYLTQLLKNHVTDIERFDGGIDLTEWLIEGEEYNKLNKIKKTSPEGFYYWYKAIELL